MYYHYYGIKVFFAYNEINHNPKGWIQPDGVLAMTSNSQNEIPEIDCSKQPVWSWDREHSIV